MTEGLTGYLYDVAAKLAEQLAVLAENSPVKDAHPYLQVWVALKRAERHGARPLPGPGGWLDQDAELTWALELCDRGWDAAVSDRANREAAVSRLDDAFARQGQGVSAPGDPGRKLGGGVHVSDGWVSPGPRTNGAPPRQGRSW
jgi:hypothetical protein